MAVRTATTETQNTAQLVQGREWGYDLVRMTSHYPTCEVCAMYQGRVYAVTKEAANGKYKDKDGNPLRFSYLYDTVLTEGRQEHIRSMNFQSSADKAHSPLQTPVPMQNARLTQRSRQSNENATQAGGSTRK